MTAIAPKRLPVNLALLVILAICAVIGMAIVTAIPTPHATQNHANEAVSVRICMHTNGPTMTYRGKFRDNSNRIYSLCDLGDGTCGLQISAKGEGGRIYEVTSFVPKSGDCNEVIDYILKSAEKAPELMKLFLP